MNTYSVIPMVAFLFNGVVWSYVFINRKESNVNKSFLLYSTNLSLWIIVEIILRQPLHSEYVMPLIKIDSIMTLSPTFWFLNFTYSFIGRKKDAIYYISMASVTTIIIISLTTNLVLADYIKTVWGFDRLQGILYFPAIIIAIMLPAVYSVYFIIKKLMTPSDYVFKRSLLLILIGSLISLLLGLISDVIIPHVFNHHNIVQVGESTTVVQSYFILVAVLKYRLFTPHVEDIAHTLFDNMRAAVMIVGSDGKITLMNAFAENLFGFNITHDAEVKIASLFPDHDLSKNFTDLEFPYKSSSGLKTLSLSQTGIYYGDHEFGKILIARDITEQKLAEEAVRESEEKYRWLFENVPDGIYLSTPGGKLISANNTLVQMLGFESKEQLLNADIVKELYMDQDERSFWVKELDTTKKLRDVELHLKRQDGNPIIVRENAHYLVDKNGVAYYEGTLTDITELKKVEKAMRSSEIRFRSVWENSAEGMRLTDKEGIIIAVNKAFCRLVEMQEEELVGKDIIATYYGSKNKDVMLQHYIERFNKRNFSPHLEQRLVSPAGHTLYLEGTYTFVDIEHETSLLLSVFRDVTERILSEMALKEREEHFRLVVETIPHGILENDLDGNITFTNSAYCKIVGCSSNEIMGKKTWEIYPTTRGQQRIKESFEYKVSNKPVPTTEQTKIETKNGNIIDVQIDWDYKKDPEEKTIGIVSIITDITKRKKYEELLNKNKLMLNHAEEIAHLGSWEWDQETDLVSCSPELFRIYGIQPEYFDQKFSSLLKMVHPDDSDKVLVTIDAALKSQSPFEYYERIIRPDGDTRILFTKGIILADLNGNAKTIYGSCLDVSEFKRVEEALINSRERLRALTASLEAAREEERAHIAREIHDELGQVLTAIKMDLTLMRDDLKIEPNLTAEETSQKLALLEKMVDRLINTVRNLSTELRPDVLDHLGLIAALEWQAKEFEKRHRIHCMFSYNVRKVELEKEKATAIFRIFQETLTNVARHSGASQVEAKLQLSQNILLLEVQDNGKGISKEQILDISSIGITGMKERAKFIGGKVFVDGTTDKGTKVVLEVPINSNEL